MTSEGVVRFEVQHRASALAPELEGLVMELDVWRTKLAALGLIGQDPLRYGGAAWGNLSARLDDDQFLVTGTQTGGLPRTDARHYAVVTHADWAAGRGRVESAGPTAPSSEAMTHAALYRALPRVRFVFHVHSPALFSRTDLAETSPEVDYGTPAMAAAVSVLAANGHRLVVMRGHLDGVLSFGATADEAGHRLLAALQET